MAKYVLSEAAEQDLLEIYAFTLAGFGEFQADAYFQSLEERLTRLADSPNLGRDVSHLRKGYRLLIHKRHSVYYKPTANGILVVRLLGPGMGPDRHLS